jgi:acyl-CoA synthetase (AMP-forming)/AMP-acid ligase II
MEWWSGGTATRMSITMLLEMAAAAYGGRTALGSRADGVSYESLSRTVAGGAGLIGASGAGSVAFVGLNGPALPALLMASAAAGVPFSPLNYRLSSDGLDQLLAQLDSPLIVADDAFEGVVRHNARVMTARAWLAAAHAAPPSTAADVADDECAVLLFTSGTTGRPKGVVLRHENLVSYVLGTVEFASAAPGDAALVSVPPYHVAAIGSALTNLYAGRRMVYLPSFHPGAWLGLVAGEGVTSAMVVPTMLARIVEHLGDATAKVPALRSLAYGGARMPATVLERALTSSFPEVGFVNAYGLTETSSTIAILTPEDHRQAIDSAEPGVRARLTSAGRPVPGIEAEVRGPDGRPASSGEAGDLWVRGPQVSGVYQGIGSVLDADGWFPTHDRARIDADGYLFIEGRADDTIIRGGENIAPAEIEDVLIRHSAVLEAVVVGVPDEEWGERIVAAIVAREGTVIDPDEIRSYVRARLRGSRTPDEVVVRRELPYTPTGKVLRREIVAELTSPPPSQVPGRT